MTNLLTNDLLTNAQLDENGLIVNKYTVSIRQCKIEQLRVE